MANAAVASRPASTGDDREPFAAFVSDDASKKVLSPIVGEYGWSAERIQGGGIANAVRALTVMTSPEFLVVDLSESHNPRSDISALAEVCEPGTVVVAIGTENDVKLYRDLINSGIQDYLIKPITAEAMREAIATALAAVKGAGAQEEAGAAANRYSTIIGVRGGVGASTIATSSAWIAAHEQGRHIALLDLDVHFGTSALTFDLEPGRGLCDALENPNRVDGLFIERATIKESDNFAILGAESPMNDPLTPDPAALGHLISEIRQNFEAVIIDVPRSTVANYPYIFNEVDEVILVSDLSLAATRDVIRLLAFFQDAAPGADVRLVLNKVAPAANNEVTQKDFEASIERKVDWTIPFDARSFVAAAKKGRSLPQANPNAKPVRVLRQIAESITGSTHSDEKKSRWGKLPSLGKK